MNVLHTAHGRNRRSPFSYRFNDFKQTRVDDYTVARETGPLSLIQKNRVLVLADDENLSHSAKDQHGKISYDLLGSLFLRHSKSCCLHAFFSRERGNDGRENYFRQRGWMPHPRDIETVKTHKGLVRKANSDNLIAFMAGVLASRHKADVIVLGTGDGDLASDLANALLNLPKTRDIVTMSIAGSTSQRLNASRHPAIAGNIEIGQDCLHQRRKPYVR